MHVTPKRRSPAHAAHAGKSVLVRHGNTAGLERPACMKQITLQKIKTLLISELVGYAAQVTSVSKSVIYRCALGEASYYKVQLGWFRKCES